VPDDAVFVDAAATSVPTPPIAIPVDVAVPDTVHVVPEPFVSVPVALTPPPFVRSTPVIVCTATK
jgi:hypothetical protein